MVMIPASLPAGAVQSSAPPVGQSSHQDLGGPGGWGNTADGCVPPAYNQMHWSACNWDSPKYGTGAPAVTATFSHDKFTFTKSLSPLPLSQVAQPDELPFTPIILISASCSKWSRERRIVTLTHAPTVRHPNEPADLLSGEDDAWQPTSGAKAKQQPRGSTQSAGCQQVTGGVETCEYTYIPGAGDDEESWALGLTPALMVTHRQVGGRELRM
jgi:hypothetical protein